MMNTAIDFLKKAALAWAGYHLINFLLGLTLPSLRDSVAVWSSQSKS